MELYCCECKKNVKARLTAGIEIYPNKKSLHNDTFWICDFCKNYVGVFFYKGKPKQSTCIPTAELRFARWHIHQLLDPIWKSGAISRKKIYAMISEKIGKEFHASEIRSIEDARNIYRIIQKIKKSFLLSETAPINPL